MTTQLVARVPDAVLEAVDGLVETGVFTSRSEAVRAGLEALVERERRAAVGRAIVAGYERVPQDDDLLWPDANTAALIAEEPW
jgi:Arc/MetJ-type ribon-helix-helix transcriptional regulator